MLHRLMHRFHRPLAVMQLAALLLWALGSAVWAYAPVSASCPMEAALSQPDVAMPKSCCSGPAAMVQAGKPMEQPASHCPGSHPGKKCCCPAVAPALADAGLFAMPVFRATYDQVFAEPLMHDALALNELVIPPTA